MGREVKRVPLDFDWPEGRVWLGYMGGICNEEVGYSIRDEDASLETLCRACRHFGRLAGVLAKEGGCPETRIHPPKGDGWQLWETVSEGSPCSPVFETAEGLAGFLAGGGGHPIGKPPSYDDALRFVNAGWAPSMVSSQEHGVESGVAHVGRATPADGEALQPQEGQGDKEE